MKYPALAGVACASAAFVLAVGSDDRPEGTDSSTDPKLELTVTRDDTSFPSGCRPRRVASRLIGFFDAFNDGDASRLRGTFARASTGDTGFKWYSVGRGNPAATGQQEYVTSDPEALPAYFEARHQQRERLTLIALAVGLRDNTGQLEYYLRREADDFDRAGIMTTVTEGKGAIECSTGRIFVWSMGMSETDSLRPALALCPGAPRRRAGHVVACSR